LPFYALPRDPPRSTPFPYTTLFRSVGVAVMTALLLRAVPPRPGDPHATVRRELAALRRPQVLVAVVTGMVGFGGVFAMYSYVAPLVREETGLDAGTVPWFLFAFGIGSVLGTWLAGRLADWDVERSVVGGFAVSVVTLLLVALGAGSAAATLVLMLVVGMLGSV